MCTAGCMEKNRLLRKLMIREAGIADIKQLMLIRARVRENILRSHRIGEADYEKYLNHLGKGWVYEVNERVVGFCIVDLSNANVWALFILPEYERKGIGKQLHDTMLHWYFSLTRVDIWLSTEVNTRAEGFYKRLGWKYAGILDNGEVKFEIDYAHWLHLKSDRF